MKYTDSEKLKRLQKDFNSLKAESNKEISELKKERRVLRAKIKALDKKLSNFDISKLEKNRRITQKTYVYRELACDINKFGMYLPTDKDRANLERFQSGELTDTENRLFFSPVTLEITINPLNGRRLQETDFVIIDSVMLFSPEYFKQLKEFSKVLSKYPPTGQYFDEQVLKKAYEVGMELLPLYMDCII